MKRIKRFAAIFRKPKWRFGAYSSLVMAMLIGIGTLLTVAVDSLEDTYGWRRDYSFNGYTATGEETKKVLTALDMPVTLYLLYQSDNLDSKLYEALLRYQQLSNHIAVKTVDLTKNPGFVTLFEGDLQTSLAANSVVVSCETTGRYRILNYEEDFIKKGYNIDTGKFEITGLAYEKNVTEAIVYVSQVEVPVIGISQGHGELSETTLKSLIDFLQDNSYDVKTVNLMSGDALSGVDLLIVADPFKDFTDGEIEAMKAFAQAGGSFFMIRDFTDPLDLANYQSLLRSYGVVPLPGIVVASENDKGSYYDERIYLLPTFASLDMTVPLIESGMDVLLLVGASAFETPEQTDASLSAVTVLMSGPNAYVRNISSGDETIDYQEGDRTGELALAILAARMHPNGNISRMFAIGNSTVFTDDYSYQRTFNQQFIMQLMESFCRRKPYRWTSSPKPRCIPSFWCKAPRPPLRCLQRCPR